MEYVNLKLQSKSGVLPCVCFSSGKRSLLLEREKTKTAVKLHRFNLSCDGRTIFVNGMTKVCSPSSSEHDFQFMDSGTAKGHLKSIIGNSMDVDVVDFLGKVISKDAGVQLVGSFQLRKMECFVADESYYVKLVLWENDIQ